jgi:hypothetical protein
MKTQATVGQQANATALDMIVNSLRYAIEWVKAECPRTRQTSRVDEKLFASAEDLLEQARQYMFFAAAYSYWRRGLIDMHLTDRHFSVTRGLDTDTRYEAYDRLVKTTNDMSTYEAPQGVSFDAAIRDRLKKGHMLNAIPFDRQLVEEASIAMDVAHASTYQLPPEWHFSGFDLREFRAVMNVLRGVQFVWNIAATVSVGYGAPQRPWWPFVVRRGALFDIARDVTGLPRSIVKSIFGLLEYGSSGIRVPDPALQPLLPLGADFIILSSMLLLGTSPERNLIVLLNQLPAERAVYAKLVNEKETLLRESMIAKMPSCFLSWTGRLPGRPDLPDIDLAVLDSQSKSVLLSELKWFVEPAEPREMVQRCEELEKGVLQSNKLFEAFAADPKLLRVIGADETWTVFAAVVSANSIGLAKSQSDQIPIARAEHLSAKLSVSTSLNDVVKWLMERRYLPMEGRDFTVGIHDIDYFGWSLDWYGIAPQSDLDFFPL